LKSLRDIKAEAKIRGRLDRIKLGNLGDCRSVGEGVFELRIDWGPGYRVYFGQIEQTIVLSSAVEIRALKIEIFVKLLNIG
jgi:putative addiction module killer protein